MRQLEATVDRLQRQVTQLAAGSGTSLDAVSLAAERDNLRARVIALQEALALTRHAAELQRRVDEERAGLVEHLLAATSAAERVDGLRREAFTALDQAVASLTQPGYLGMI